jgi:hypothetical protein
MALNDDLRSVFKNQFQTEALHAGPIVNEALHIATTYVRSRATFMSMLKAA